MTDEPTAPAERLPLRVALRSDVGDHKRGEHIDDAAVIKAIWGSPVVLALEWPAESAASAEAAPDLAHEFTHEEH